MSDNEGHQARIPNLAKKLGGKENYATWRFDAEVALDYYRALKIVTGTATPASHPGDAPSPPASDATSAVKEAAAEEAKEYKASLKAYKKASEREDDKSSWATFFLLSNIKDLVKKLIPRSRDPAIIWKALEEQFDLQTVSTLFDTFGNLISLQYSPDTPLKEHLTTFTDLWETVVERCSKAKETDTDNFAWHLKNMTSSQMSKKNFLLQTLKDESLANVVENLISKEAITYAEIHDKFMAIATAREKAATSAESFSARSGDKKPFSKAPKDVSKECSFCKKNGDVYQGHLTRD